MSMARLIIWILLFYIVYRIANNVMKIVRGYNSKTEAEKKEHKKTKYNIAKDDVIEAHFEDINTNKSDKSKENS